MFVFMQPTLMCCCLAYFLIEVITKIKKIIIKIDFVVSPEAFIHSIVQYNDGSISLNCFNNDMIITLSKPLNYFYNFITKTNSSLFFNHKSYYFEKFSDNRFEIVKNIKIYLTSMP